MEKTFTINGSEVKVQDYLQKGDTISFTLEGKQHSYRLVSKDGNSLILENGHRFKAHVGSPNKEGESMVMALGREAVVVGSGRKMKKAGTAAGGLTSPMPGKIFKILKPAGETVTKGETVLILEGMKMEHSIRADKDGQVKKINYKVGDLVQGGVVLAELE